MSLSGHERWQAGFIGWPILAKTDRSVEDDGRHFPGRQWPSHRGGDAVTAHTVSAIYTSGGDGEGSQVQAEPVLREGTLRRRLARMRVERGRPTARGAARTSRAAGAVWRPGASLTLRVRIGRPAGAPAATARRWCSALRLPTPPRPPSTPPVAYAAPATAYAGIVIR